jgi:hypothetical protein
MIFQANPQPLLSGNETMQILLSIHILAGTIALFCAAMAVFYLDIIVIRIILA